MHITYDITVTCKGHTRTYKDAEREYHEEFYVESLDRFYEELTKSGIDIGTWKWFFDNHQTSYVKRFRNIGQDDDVIYTRN